MADNGATDGCGWGGHHGHGHGDGEPQQLLPPSPNREARRRASGPSATAALRPQRRAAAVAQMKGGLGVAFSCQRCRMSKTRCSGDLPCQRCFRLSLPCIPQRLRERGPGSRARNEAKERAQAAEGGAAEDAFCAQPLLDQVIQRVDPLPMAAMFLRAFHAALRAGRIDVDKTRRTLRIWRAQSLLLGADCSWGIIDEVGRALGLGPLDLEDMQGPDAEEAPPAVRKARLRERMLGPASQSARARLVEGLKRLEGFQRYDDGRDTSVCVTLMLDDPAQGVVRATNAVRDRRFRASRELASDVWERRTIHILLAAGLIAPGDRPDAFRDMVTTGFGKDPERITTFIKLIGRDGDIRLFIMRYTPVSAAEVSALGATGCHAVIHSLEPVPPSRHINDKPGSQYSVIKAFRSVSHFAPPPLSSPTAAGDGSSTGNDDDGDGDGHGDDNISHDPIPMPDEGTGGGGGDDEEAGALLLSKGRKRPRPEDGGFGGSRSSSRGSSGSSSDSSSSSSVDHATLQLPPCLSFLPVPLLDGGAGAGHGKGKRRLLLNQVLRGMENGARPPAPDSGEKEKKGADDGGGDGGGDGSSSHSSNSSGGPVSEASSLPPKKQWQQLQQSRSQQPQGQEEGKPGGGGGSDEGDKDGDGDGDGEAKEEVEEDDAKVVALLSAKAQKVLLGPSPGMMARLTPTPRLLELEGKHLERQRASSLGGRSRASSPSSLSVGTPAAPAPRLGIKSSKAPSPSPSSSSSSSGGGGGKKKSGPGGSSLQRLRQQREQQQQEQQQQQIWEAALRQAQAGPAAVAPSSPSFPILHGAFLPLGAPLPSYPLHAGGAFDSATLAAATAALASYQHQHHRYLLAMAAAASAAPPPPGSLAPGGLPPPPELPPAASPAASASASSALLGHQQQHQQHQQQQQAAALFALAQAQSGPQAYNHHPPPSAAAAPPLRPGIPPLPMRFAVTSEDAAAAAGAGAGAAASAAAAPAVGGASAAVAQALLSLNWAAQ